LLKQEKKLKKRGKGPQQEEDALHSCGKRGPRQPPRASLAAVTLSTFLIEKGGKAKRYAGIKKEKKPVLWNAQLKGGGAFRRGHGDP